MKTIEIKIASKNKERVLVISEKDKYIDGNATGRVIKEIRHDGVFRKNDDVITLLSSEEELALFVEAREKWL